MTLRTVVAGFGLALACAKPQAGGDPREVVILADEPVWETIKGTAQAVFERTVHLLEEEKVFWTHHLDAQAFPTVRRHPLLLFAAAEDQPGPVGHLVEQITGSPLSSLAQRAPYARSRDPWARGQVVYFVVGRTSAHVDSILSAVGPLCYADFLERYRTVVRERLYVRGPNLKAAKYLAQRYGWSLEVPNPWQMEEKPEERWVHFVKTDPDRHVSVYWEDWADTTLPAPHCVRTRNALAWRHYDEDKIDETRTTVAEVEFQGRRAWEIRGAWVNEKYVAGGPFRTLCFLVPEQRRFYLIDLVAFAPDRPKFYVMTQLDLIAQTFRVQDAASPDPRAG